MGSLPPRLHQQAKQHSFDLALRASSTGDLRDAFIGVDRFPLLSVGIWLLRDLGPGGRSVIAGEPSADDVECGLFLASFLGALRSQAAQSISDQVSLSDWSHLAIVQWCTERAVTHLGRFIPAGEPFWSRYEALSSSELELSIDPQAADLASRHVHGPAHTRWSYPASVVALAAVQLARPEADIAETVRASVNDLAVAFQIWDDLSTLTRDLADQKTTYPIAQICQAGGITLNPWPRSIEVLGAMVATGALETILETASARLASTRRAAAQLGLPTFARFLGAVAEADSKRAALLTGAVNDSPFASVAAFSFRTEEPSSAKAIAMAEAFLLSDLTFRESWETHREGMLGSAEVSSRFPASLVLEVLCRHGHGLSEGVEDFISNAEANGFRYYDHPSADADADTVGAVLRLLKYSPRRAGPSKELTDIITCVDRLLEENGQIPVWLTVCSEPNARRPRTLTLGEGCGTVVAHFLLGLSELGDQHAATAQKGAAALFDRVADVGLGANVNYPPRYSLATFFRLLQRCGDHPAQAVLIAELERRSRAPISSAQEAALAILAAWAARRHDLIDEGWIATILRRQRFDGSWMGEPFAVAPNRGWRVSAYSSTTLTTALCYDALAGTRERAPAEP